MSLVHDALEKAKREASSKTARELGLPESKVATGQPFRARKQLHGLMVGATVAALAIGAIVGFFARSKGEKETTGVEPRSAPTQADTPAPELQPDPRQAPSEGGILGTVPVPPPPAQPTSSIAEPESAPTAAPASSQAPAPPAAPPAEPTPSSSTGARTAPSRTNGRPPTYVRQYTLLDGTVVRLGGIAWSDAAPLAYLNGKLYAKGESVEGLTIEAIEKDRVVLAGASGRIALTLR